MGRRIALALVAAVAGAVSSTAQAAHVKLVLNYDTSSITAGLRLPSGLYAVQAPYSGIRFQAGAANDAGFAVLKPDGSPAYATMDLIARRADGTERVVDSQTIWDQTPVTFDMQYIEQTTTYVARLNPTAAGGVAAPTDSNAITVPTLLKNYPGATYSRSTGWLRFSGRYARVPTLPNLTASLRILVQRRSGSSWRTVRTLVPDAGHSWRGAVNVGGAQRAVYRLRTVPIGPRRYVALTDYKFCIAPTVAEQRRLCAGVGWEPR